MAGLVASIRFPCQRLVILPCIEAGFGIAASPGLATGIYWPCGDLVDPPSRSLRRQEYEGAHRPVLVTTPVERASLPLSLAMDCCDFEGRPGIACSVVVVVDRKETSVNRTGNQERSSQKPLSETDVIRSDPNHVGHVRLSSISIIQ